MRVIICGDTHIGAVLGLGKPNGKGGNTRVDDYEETLNYIVDYTIESGADVFIQTGDVFDTRNPDPEHIAVINRCIRKMSNAGVTSIWLMGNHDYKRSGETFTSAITSLAAKDYPNTRVVLKPEVVEIVNKEGDKASFILMPFRDRRMYSGESTKQDSEEYQAEVQTLIDTCDKTSPIIAIGHNFFFEGSYHHYGGTEVLIDIDAFKDCDMVAMGHYHQFKPLRTKNPIAFYTGSMERLNFGDAKIEKYFIDYNTSNKKVSVKKTPVKTLVDKYISLEDADFSNLHKRIEEEVSKVEVDGTIVRVKIAVKDTLASSVKKPDVQKILYDNGAYFVSKVLVDPIHKRLNRDLDILEEKSDFDMFEAFLKKQDLADEMKEDILKEAKKVMV
jgi:exonuclease SbcD